MDGPLPSAWGVWRPQHREAAPLPLETCVVAGNKEEENHNDRD